VLVTEASLRSLDYFRHFLYILGSCSKTARTSIVAPARFDVMTTSSCSGSIGDAEVNTIPARDVRYDLDHILYVFVVSSWDRPAEPLKRSTLDSARVSSSLEAVASRLISGRSEVTVVYCGLTQTYQRVMPCTLSTCCLHNDLVV
jgi:hypothetical protein